MIENHWLDSGAHTWTNLLFKKAKKAGGKIDWGLYDSQEFWDYVDKYAVFVKKWKHRIDHYINVDIIRDPKRSWKVLKYLENEHGLNPMPVIHFNCPLKWIEKHLDAGYEYIGMGGPVGKIPYEPWADRAWNLICSTSNRLPAVKIHGFAVTTHKHIVRYPWYSVDSVTWKKMSYFSQILVPPRLGRNAFNFSVPNLVVFIDAVSPYTNRRNGKGRHFMHYSRQEQKGIRDWLDFINVPFGERHKDNSIKTEGVTNSNFCRVQANIAYFQHLAAHQPPWPWPFRQNTRPTLLECME
jgi:hypothetical protein